jgi:hypothetical protein
MGPDNLPLMTDFSVSYNISKCPIREQIPGYTIDWKTGANGLLFLCCEPGVNVRFPRKSHPMIAIDIESGAITRSPGIVDGYCRFDNPTELGICLDQGGRVELSRDFRVAGKTRVFRFACKDFLIVF